MKYLILLLSMFGLIAAAQDQPISVQANRTNSQLRAPLGFLRTNIQSSSTITVVPLTGADDGKIRLDTTINAVTDPRIPNSAITNVSALGGLLGSDFTFEGDWGWTFRVARPMKVTALGFYHVAGMSNDLTLYLRLTNGCQELASVRYHSPGPSVATNRWYFCPLPFDYTLTTNVDYEVAAYNPSLGVPLPNVSTVNYNRDILPGRAVSPNYACYGYSGWASNALGLVNFLYYDGSSSTNGHVHDQYVNLNDSRLENEAVTNMFVGYLDPAPQAGDHGWTFSVTRPMQVTALGFYHVAGMSNNLSIYLRKTNNCETLGQVRYISPGPTVGTNHWYYVNLSFPVALTTNVQYSVAVNNPVLGGPLITDVTPIIPVSRDVVFGLGVTPAYACYGYGGYNHTLLGPVSFLYNNGNASVVPFKSTNSSDVQISANFSASNIVGNITRSTNDAGDLPLFVGSASGQTNIAWQGITNVATVQIPWASITNPPTTSQTNIAMTGVTNLPHWLTSTNELYARPSAAITNIVSLGGLFTPGTDGDYGWTFQVARPMKITHLGFWYRAGMSNSPITLYLRRTNNCEVLSSVVYWPPPVGSSESNRFSYVPLPFMVSLTTNQQYEVAGYVRGSTVSWPIADASTVNYGRDILPGLGTAPSVTCLGYSGWPSNVLGLVTFLYTTGGSVDENIFRINPTGLEHSTASPGSPMTQPTLDVAIPIRASMEASYYNQPFDNARFSPHPLRNLDGFNDTTPDPVGETYIRGATEYMSTNGCAAAGWDTVGISDGWATNRDANGVLVPRGDYFTNSIAWLANFVHTNGMRFAAYTAWNTNSGTFAGAVTLGSPYQYLSNDIVKFVNWGADMYMYDNSLNPQCRTLDEYIRSLRIINQASLVGLNRLGVTNRGLELRIGGNLDGYELQDFTNNWIPYEVANAVNSLTINGRENYAWEDIQSKINAAFKMPWFTRPGHALDAQSVRNTSSPEYLRSIFNMYAIGPLAMATTMGTMQSAGNLPLFTNRTFWAYYDDPAWLPGGRAWSNSLNEVWVRPIGAKITNTNLVCFVNGNTTQQTITFSNSVVGLAATQRMNAFDPWYNTNKVFTGGTFSVTVPATNATLFVISGCITNASDYAGAFYGDAAGLTNNGSLLASFADIKAAGTTGDSATRSNWTRVLINSVQYTNSSALTLTATNTLLADASAAGVWLVDASVPFGYKTASGDYFVKTRLRRLNNTAATLLLGTAESVYYYDGLVSHIRGVVTLASGDILSLEGYHNIVGGGSQAVQFGFMYGQGDSSGESNLYSNIIFHRNK